MVHSFSAFQGLSEESPRQELKRPVPGRRGDRHAGLIGFTVLTDRWDPPISWGAASSWGVPAARQRRSFARRANGSSLPSGAGRRRTYEILIPGPLPSLKGTRGLHGTHLEICIANKNAGDS